MVYHTSVVAAMRIHLGMDTEMSDWVWNDQDSSQARILADKDETVKYNYCDRQRWLVNVWSPK